MATALRFVDVSFVPTLPSTPWAMPAGLAAYDDEDDCADFCSCCEVTQADPVRLWEPPNR